MRLPVPTREEVCQLGIQLFLLMTTRTPFLGLEGTRCFPLSNISLTFANELKNTFLNYEYFLFAF